MIEFISSMKESIIYLFVLRGKLILMGEIFFGGMLYMRIILLYLMNQ